VNRFWRRLRRTFLTRVVFRRKYSESALTLFFAVFIGVTVGFVTVGYHEFIAFIYEFFFRRLPRFTL
jgi:hypothetical protein